MPILPSRVNRVLLPRFDHIGDLVLLTGFHGFLVAQAKRVGAGERPLSERQLRMLGEVPGLLLVLIVVLVVLKPF